MNTDVQTIARRPRVGDVVLSPNGYAWEVESVHHDGLTTRIAYYGVVSLNGRYPNAFDPTEVRTVAARDAADRDSLATYEGNL